MEAVNGDDNFTGVKAGMDQFAKTWTDLMVPLVAEVNDEMRKRQIEESIRVQICVAVFDVLTAKIPR